MPSYSSGRAYEGAAVSSLETMAACCRSRTGVDLQSQGECQWNPGAVTSREWAVSAARSGPLDLCVPVVAERDTPFYPCVPGSCTPSEPTLLSYYPKA